MSNFKAETKRYIERLFDSLNDLHKNVASLSATVVSNRRHQKDSNQALRARLHNLEATVVVLAERHDLNLTRVQTVVDALAEKNGYKVNLIEASEEHVELAKIDVPKKPATRRRY